MGSTFALNHSLLSISTPTASSESILSPESSSPDAGTTAASVSGKNPSRRAHSSDTWSMLFSNQHPQVDGRPSDTTAGLLPWLHRTSSLNTLLESSESPTSPTKPASSSQLRSNSLDATLSSKKRFQLLTQLMFCNASPISDISSSDDDNETINQDLMTLEDVTATKADTAKCEESLMDYGRGEQGEGDTCAGVDTTVVENENDKSMSSSFSSDSLSYPRAIMAPLSSPGPVRASSNPPDIIPDVQLELASTICGRDVTHVSSLLSTELPPTQAIS